MVCEMVHGETGVLALGSASLYGLLRVFGMELLRVAYCGALTHVA